MSVRDAYKSWRDIPIKLIRIICLSDFASRLYHWNRKVERACPWSNSACTLPLHVGMCVPGHQKPGVLHVNLREPSKTVLEYEDTAGILLATYQEPVHVLQSLRYRKIACTERRIFR